MARIIRVVQGNMTPIRFRKIGATLIVVVSALKLQSCGMLYDLVVSESYDVTGAECTNQQGSVSPEYRFEFDKRSFLEIVGSKGEKYIRKFRPDIITSKGPYNLSIGVTEASGKVRPDFVVRDMKIESSLSRDYSKTLNSFLPLVLKPKIRSSSLPKGSKPDDLKGGVVECEVVPQKTNPNFYICEYIQYVYETPPTFDFQFDNGEKLYIELDIEDRARKVSGTLCYRAVPKLIKKRLYYSIGV
ncbi:hypothetical protein [Microbulbifer sp.]|uniref:hypothetical protein n=1 Tax=Microbulbifer sp. TaxID=1908541 RepID=UPI003F332F74